VPTGKTISGILKKSKEQNIPVAALCGSIELSLEEQEDLGLDYATSIIKKPGTLEEIMQRSYDALVFASYNFAKQLRKPL